jgi:hypothetical protein
MSEFSLGFGAAGVRNSSLELWALQQNAALIEAGRPAALRKEAEIQEARLREQKLAAVLTAKTVYMPLLPDHGNGFFTSEGGAIGGTH